MENRIREYQEIFNLTGTAIQNFSVKSSFAYFVDLIVSLKYVETTFSAVTVSSELNSTE